MSQLSHFCNSEYLFTAVEGWFSFVLSLPSKKEQVNSFTQMIYVCRQLSAFVDQPRNCAMDQKKATRMGGL